MARRSEAPAPDGPHLTDDGRGGLAVCVHGEIDATTADRFAACVARALAVSDHLVVDLSEATFMDSTGLAVLVAARRALDGDGRHVVVHGAHGPVRRVLEVTGIDQLITLDDIGPVDGRDGTPQAERDRQSSQTK